MSIKKYIPDFITSMNLLCGVIGVVFAFKCRFDMAFYFMLAAAVFDFMDGFVARLLGAYSDLGKELDSLSDVVSFGVLPSVMLYSLMKTFMFGESLVCWVPLLFWAFLLRRVRCCAHLCHISCALLRTLFCLCGWPDRYLCLSSPLCCASCWYVIFRCSLSNSQRKILARSN